jgi:hypothetical protein
MEIKIPKDCTDCCFFAEDYIDLRGVDHDFCTLFYSVLKWNDIGVTKPIGCLAKTEIKIEFEE